MAHDLADVRRLVAAEHGLATIATLRPDGRVTQTLINAGVCAHPETGADVVALVIRGGTRKQSQLRANPWASVSWRSGWDWVTAEGPAELLGPDDGAPADLPRLLRDVFTGAGGSHEDWDEYDRVMAAERRTAVLLTPARIYGNPA